MSNQSEDRVLGRVGIILKGEYDSTAKYTKLNQVTYNGSSYILKVAEATGIVPTNTAYWICSAQKGDKGDKGNKGDKGDKPVAGVDYYTEQEKEAFKTEIISESEQDIETLVANKKTEFNDNATVKTSAFNSNAEQKTTEYNNNHTAKLAEYNANADEVINTNTAISNLIDKEFDNGTAEGTEITINDSAEWYGKLVSSGQMSQEQYEGRNLLPCLEEGTWTNDGITLTSDGKGSYMATGIATKNTSVIVDLATPATLPESALYIHLRNNATSNNAGVVLRLSSGDAAVPTISNANRVLESTKLVGATITGVGIHVDEGAEVNVIFMPTVELTNNVTEFEKFVGGQASPNPNYPQEVHTVKGDNVVRHAGKNWFNIDAVIQGVWNNPNANQRLVGFFVKILRGQKCTVQNFNSALKFSCAVSSENKISNTATSTDDVGWITSKKRTFTASQNGYVFVQISKLDNSVITQQEISATDFQIEIGDTETPYETYRGENYDLNLGDIELCKIGDYKDKLFKNVVEDENYNTELVDGAWYKKKEIGKHILNGTENWVTATTRSDYNKVVRKFLLEDAILGKNTAQNLIVSQHFKSGSSESIFKNASDGINFAGINDDGYLQIGLELDKFPTDASFMEFLAENNDTLYYPLEIPVYEQITNPTLTSQLESLNKVGMYHGVNNFYTEAQDLEPSLDLTYKVSNKIKNEQQNTRLDNIESRLALLE